MEKLAKLKTYILKAAIGLAIITPVFFMIAALGTKIGVWGWKFGFGTLTRNLGPKLMMLTLVVALIALILSVIIKPRKDWLIALLCMAVPITGIGFGKKVGAKARSLPFIHDITTDTQNPPTFSQAIIDRRAQCSNSLDYIGVKVPRSEELVSVAQYNAYGDINTMVFSDSAEALYKRALATVEAMGWKQALASSETGIIEATDSTFWFGFKDDVAIRIQASEGGGSILDIRSISCVGGSDIGANAARIRAFRKKLGN